MPTWLPGSPSTPASTRRSICRPRCSTWPGVRRRVPVAALVGGDAAALPLRDHAADLTLAPHMLYHVPDLQGVIAELRRITRPGGTVLVVLNGHDHLRELHDLVTGVFQDTGRQAPPRAHPLLEDGPDLLASQFASVTRHDFISELRITAPEPVANYVRSTIGVQNQPGADGIAAAVASRFPTGDGVLQVRAHTGCLVCI
jgi:SAM-dependent methyltransferase